MIRLENINKSFGSKAVLCGFSANFEQGKRYCIMGASGGGKTTLLNIILGLQKADSGTVSGVPEHIAAVFQEDRLCEPYSALANVLAVTGSTVPEAEIIALLGALGLEGNERIAVNKLSGGMRRRVALARALLAKSELIILDEAFKGLDDATRERVISVLCEYSAGKTLILATHDLRDAVSLGAEVIEL